MNKDDHIIKELIREEIRPIPNADFTRDTIKKIQAAKAKEKSRPILQYNPLLLPAIIYTSLFVLLLISKSILQIFQLDASMLSKTFDSALDYLTHPLALAITISVVMLYCFDQILEQNIRKPTEKTSKIMF